MKNQRSVVPLAVALLLLAAAAALAHGIVIPHPIIWPPPPRPPRPMPPPPPVAPLELRNHNVAIEIRDGAAVTKVDQVFFNPNPRELEGTYLFPLPEGGAIQSFSMFIDGKETKAELLDRDKARQIYEDIVRRMRDPALLEYVNRRTFQARVYPIPANGEKRVKLEYAEPLPIENGVMAYRYPLTTARLSGKPLKEVTIQAAIRTALPLKSIVSPSHNVDVARRGDHEARVSYEAANTLPDKDFHLYVTVSRSDFGLHLVTYKRPGEAGYFMAMISPGVEIAEDRVQPKDLLLVLDTSGSMAQEGKMAQARNALKFCLRRLNPGDRFGVIDFSTAARKFRDDLVAAEEANVAAALEYVDKLEAKGGTAIAEALAESVKMARADRPLMIVFLTDGRPTIGKTDTEEILKELRAAPAGRLRLFTFGVGHDLNTLLLDRLAADGRGARAYVTPGEDIETKVAAFYRKISSPVLANLKLDFRGGKVEEVYPRTLGDLFRGSELTVVGRYHDPGDRALVLTGEIEGRAREFVYEGRFAAEDTANEFLPRAWAARKIGFLIDEIRLHGENQELREEVVRLSTQYGIITPYTSFLVLEDIKAGGPGRPVPLPAAPVMDYLRRERAGEMMKAGAAARAEGGRDAVGFSLSARAMQAAPAPPPADEFLGRAARQLMVQLGPRAFYQRDGVWTVATWTPDRKTEKVKYLSDEYFALARRADDLARAFALGERVIAEWQGVFYEVIAE